jgi:hypothetical protein
MGQAKEDPEIAEALSVKLVEAKDEADVAEAITAAKTDTQLKTLTDPVERKLVQDEAKIAVCFMRSDLKAKSREVAAEQEFEEAETEEEIEEIYQRNELLANELEGAEVVEAKASARASKLDMSAKEEEYKGKIRTRTNGMRLRIRYQRIMRRAKLAARRLSYTVGEQVNTAKNDSAAAEVLAAAKTEGDSTVTNLQTEIADFKAEVSASGAAETVQTWATTALDEGLVEVEAINKGINISNAIAQAKITATTAVLKARKDLGKEIYLATTEAEVEAAVAKADGEKTAIKTALSETIQEQIATGADLTGVKPAEEMNAKNAVEYLTSTTFMTEAKAASEADFDTKFEKVTSSFTRGAALAKQRLSKAALTASLAAAKERLAAARAKIVTIRAGKATALE